MFLKFFLLRAKYFVKISDRSSADSIFGPIHTASSLVKSALKLETLSFHAMLSAVL